MIGLIAVFLISLVGTFGLCKLASRLNLLALPGEHRQHQDATPMVGGIAIYFGILAGLPLVDDSYLNLMPSLTLLTVIGVLDDRYKLPSWSRFIAQGVAVYLMIKLTGVQLHSLGAVFSEYPSSLGQWSIPLTIFASIGVINAINMSDGLDGLAASMVIVVIIGMLYYGIADQSLALVTCAAIVGFLLWNMRVFRSRAKVFMGDAGSTGLGLILAYLLIKSSQSPSAFPPVTALWLLALPLIDAVAVLIVRPLRGRSPFGADRIHYHHLLLKRNLMVNTVVLIALIGQVMLIALSVYLLDSGVSEQQQLRLFLFISILYLIRLIWFTRTIDD